MNLIAQITCTMSTSYGTGRHLAALPPQDAMRAIKLNIISNPFGIMAFCVPKVAVALLLIRLMGPGNLRRWLLYFVTSVMMIAGILSAIFLFAQCRPVAALWDPAVAPIASCWHPSVLTDYTYFVGGTLSFSRSHLHCTNVHQAYSAFCDFVLAVFPISIIWNLQMPMRRKIGICFLLSLGLL